MINLTTFKETPEGLLISLNTEYVAEIQEVRDTVKDGNFNYQSLWADLLETPLCNGYHNVPDEYKGLTEAPMISDTFFDEETTKDEFESAKVWAFLDYQTRDELRELVEKGFVLFPLVNNGTQQK